MLRPTSRHRCLAMVGVTTALFTAPVVIGCSRGGPTDSEQVMFAISNLTDAARDRDPKSFQLMFVSGAAPGEDQRANYRKYLFNMDQPEVSGESAMVTVRATSAEGDVLGAMEWQLAMEDGEWKIKDAPLP